MHVFTCLSSNLIETCLFFAGFQVGCLEEWKGNDDDQSSGVDVGHVGVAFDMALTRFLGPGDRHFKRYILQAGSLYSSGLINVSCILVLKKWLKLFFVTF